ncbi:MAG: CoB--CoM heterodisulfide reductase iron-sulfur subunit A family protein [Candidatus Zixiibacteriota bacterium]|nr:MAG: CoB--CoM heterodisulfide reductase iron-sulfur subunit A family protein [candidate division Zixibacteria bacterium]
MNVPDNGARITADLLVVGGGIAGMTAAIEASEMGLEVVLVEKEPFLGGRVAQFNQYFPKMCPPWCGLEINYRRLRGNDKVRILTLTTVDQASGGPGNCEARLTIHPRYVNENCTACGDCAQACPVDVPDEYNFGLSTRKAVYYRDMAFPPLYVVDPALAGDPRLQACRDACKYEAVDLAMQPVTVTVQAKGIIWATGWQPYDANKLDTLGFGKFPNVVTNVMLERLASAGGPTEGKIRRPSDQGAIGKIAFVQCAGSRDANHLPYCSGVCCAASIKQAQYVREQYPEAEIHLFYIDVRTPGRLEDFYAGAEKDAKIFFHRGKVGEIREAANHNLIVAAENTLTGKVTEMEVEMAVLATGMVPNTAQERPPLDTPLDEWGFVGSSASGVTGAGVASRPADVAASVQQATGSVIQALLAQRR